ncbi:MAG: hypothetical protein HC890_04120 [Chloroflexaceae bacterium]|nr:hypothetical protein [Chloroflexaceae bacterium]
MSFNSTDYEILLSEYSNRDRAIALLQQYRPYLELLPSLRRAADSLVPIPLPLLRLRSLETGRYEVKRASCELAMLMCDPQWKVKMGSEVLIFIHRAAEDFSGLLSRWRQTQIDLHGEYEWLMPLAEQHMFNERAEQIYPLFVVFPETPERIMRGLTGAGLPFVVPELPRGADCDRPDAVTLPDGTSS